jgi:hypothetical protein
LLRFILGGKEETQEAGSVRNGLRITTGGYFEETNACGRVRRRVPPASEKASVETSHSSRDGGLAYDAGFTSLTRDNLVVNPFISLFEAIAERGVGLPL